MKNHIFALYNFALFFINSMKKGKAPTKAMPSSSTKVEPGRTPKQPAQEQAPENVEVGKLTSTLNISYKNIIFI